MKTEGSHPEVIPSVASLPSFGDAPCFNIQIPKWLKSGFERVQKDHPRSNLRLFYESPNWKIQCISCTKGIEPKVRPTSFLLEVHDVKEPSIFKVLKLGSRKHLGPLKKHLGARPHQLASGTMSLLQDDAVPQTPDGRRAERSPHLPTPGPSNVVRRDAPGDDAVERFLAEIGLPVQVAEQLRTFGILNEERLNMIAAFDDDDLEVLMTKLHEEVYLDWVLCIAIRRALKARREAVDEHQ